jgi:hypothetical protein
VCRSQHISRDEGSAEGSRDAGRALHATTCPRSEHPSQLTGEGLTKTNHLHCCLLLLPAACCCCLTKTVTVDHPHTFGSESESHDDHSGACVGRAARDGRESGTQRTESGTESGTESCRDCATSESVLGRSHRSALRKPSRSERPRALRVETLGASLEARGMCASGSPLQYLQYFPDRSSISLKIFAIPGQGRGLHHAARHPNRLSAQRTRPAC